MQLLRWARLIQSKAAKEILLIVQQDLKAKYQKKI